MELEIKHLAPYLPYKIKVLRSFYRKKQKIELVTKNNFGSYFLPNRIVKPILYQLNFDNLTKEIEYNGEKIIPIYYIFQPDYKNFKHKIEVVRQGLFSTFIMVHIWANDTFYRPHKLELRSIISQNLPFYVFDNLYKLHFDFYDLVINNLAVEKSKI